MRKKTKGIFVAALVFAATTQLGAASLRVLLIGDTNDRSIGKSVVTDLANFEKFTRDIAQNTGLPIDIRIIKGGEVKSKKITDAINTLKVESDDTVIFYYSGHGFRTKQVKTRWPLLYIPDAGTKGVDFQWVIDTLGKKNPRMLLAISDSCNSFIDTPQRSVNTRAMRPEQAEAWKKLFVEFSGKIYASGSQIGQYSFGQDQTGGAFTSRFLSIVRGEVTDTRANWDNIMRQATKQIPINSPQQRTQDPQYEMVKGQQAQQPVAQIDLNPPQQAQPATSEEDQEHCKDLGEFQSAIAQVKDSMPAKFDFRKQADDLANYKELVKALLQAGGDKQMVSLSKTMDQGLKAKNWSKFRSAMWAYAGHLNELQQQMCSGQ